MFVDCDAKGRLTSRSIHEFGAATLDASSPPYADQAPLFAAKRIKMVLFTDAELAGRITSDYRAGTQDVARFRTEWNVASSPARLG